MSTWVTSQPEPLLTATKGTDQVHAWRLISTRSSRRFGSLVGASAVTRNESFWRYACITATRRSQSAGCLVWEADPLAVPHRVPILARLLSATAFMKPCTAPAAEPTGSAGAGPPPHATRKSAAANHRCWITSLSLVGC